MFYKTKTKSIMDKINLKEKIVQKNHFKGSFKMYSVFSINKSGGKCICQYGSKLEWC